tara:strand:- start:168 stop:665 length:498 start_codon:yes stop_codon:yes gene_type:complete
MTIDASFWVAISFFIFIGLLVYFKIPERVKNTLNDNIAIIKDQIYNAEKLKDEAKNILSEHEKKISSSKLEIKKMVEKANEETEKNILKTNSEFHALMENKKKNAELKVEQMKEQAIKEIKNTSVKISIAAVERLLKNSLDKSKLNKLYLSSLEETKVALKKKPS